MESPAARGLGMELALHALEGVVHAFTGAAQVIGDLLIGHAGKEQVGYLLFKGGKAGIEPFKQIGFGFFMEEGFLRVLAGGGEHVGQLPGGVGFRVQGAAQGDVAVQGHMLIPAGQLHGADDLPGDAHAGKGLKGSFMAGLIMQDGAV